jgi:ubiquinol-cytochrome c reductase cytochrome b subunit
MGRIGDWLDERTGHRALIRHALAEPISGGASWAYVFGSVLVFLLVMQLVTGICLACYYSPSASGAWASVAYVQDQVSWGWLVRGLHGHGASAMVIVLGLHLVQVALAGAYRRPREVTWWFGVLLMGLILGFALTGYLLPWDQKGYWATKVATGIMGETPLLGTQLRQVVQGGNEYGTLTISRFFALHVFVLPLLTVLLVVGHVALFRKHGVTPLARRRGKPNGVFHPDQLLRDVVAAGLVLLVVVVTTVWSGGVPLGAPADPSSGFDARPEWYFLPLFQLLKYFSGGAGKIVALGAPAVAGGLLLAVPYLDRAPRHGRARALVPLALLGAGAITLGILAVLGDARDPALARRQQAELAQARRARTLALSGMPAGGGLAVYDNDPLEQGRKLYASHCASCHDAGQDQRGPLLGPGFLSRAWLRGFLQAPDDPRHFGKVKKVHASDDRMKPVKLRGQELDAVVEWLYSEGGAPGESRAVNRELVIQGKLLFDAGNCADCHERDGTTESSPGPNLGGLGSPEHLAAFIAEPAAPRFFADLNDMPSFAAKLRPAELDALVRYLRSFAVTPRAP